MEKGHHYTECERDLIRSQGYDLPLAAEICANGEGRFSRYHFSEPLGNEEADGGGDEYAGLE